MIWSIFTEKFIAAQFFFAAIEIMNYSEVHLLKAGIYFLQISIDKAAVLNPPLVNYFRAEGYNLIRKILLGIGKIASSHY